ncbi:MAG: Bax inhibitor-1/YccA family protein [Holosporales bacterium]|jgi:FtsH-binding integral membrane protein|nr:Bax inhibitor-1/YccA family protein [Holosporales bacterium]
MSRDFDDGPVITGNGSGIGDVKRYMTLVYNRMFAALSLTGGVAMICASSQGILEFMLGGFTTILMLATIGIVIYLSAKINTISAERASSLFWIYSALMGAWISPILAMYTGESIAMSFFVAAAFFGGMSLYGRLTNRDLTSLGSFMFIGVISVLIASFANAFMGSSRLQLGLSVLSVIIFCGLTAYDVQKIMRFYNGSDSDEILRKKAVFGALSLYLDFINIFLALLRIMGRRR